MKKVPLFFVLFMFFMINTFHVLANDQIDIEGDYKAGITPESPFYKLDLLLEDLSLRLTFKNERKVEKLINNANERLAELNSIDLEESYDWIDKIYDEYGSSLNTANELYTKLVVSKQLKETKLIKLQNKIETSLLLEEKINNTIKGHLNDELADKVKEVKVDSYLTTMPTTLTKENLKKLKEAKVNHKNIVTINALANLSGLTIDELLELDIYKVGKEQLEIDMKKLENELGMTKEQIVDNLKEYNSVLKEINKGNSNNNSQQQDEVERIKEEQKEKLEKIKEKVKEQREQNGNANKKK